MATASGGRVWQCDCAAGNGPGFSIRLGHQFPDAEGAIRLALESNPQLRAASSQIGSAAGRAYQSRLWSNPDLELSAEDWPTGGGGFSDAKKLVGVSQTVPFPGKKKLDGKIGSLGVRVSEAEFSLRRVELVREVKTSFFEVLAAGRLVDVARELVGVADSLAATARKRVQAGAAADQEQLRAEIPLEEARTGLAGFEREQEIARQKFATVLGRPDLKGVPVSGELAEAADLSVLNEGPERWLPKHPGVLAAQASKERAEAELRRARLEPYPDVKLAAAGGQEAGDTGSIVQFTLSVPVPIIDRSKGRKQEAAANVSIAEAELAATEQRLLQDWGMAANACGPPRNRWPTIVTASSPRQTRPCGWCNGASRKASSVSLTCWTLNARPPKPVWPTNRSCWNSILRRLTSKPCWPVYHAKPPQPTISNPKLQSE